MFNKAVSLIVLLVVVNLGVAQDAKQKELLETPDNVTALNAYFGKAFAEIQKSMQTDPDAALKQLDALSEFAKKLQPTKQGSRRMVSRARSTVVGLKLRVEAKKVSLDQLLNGLKDSPDDIAKYGVLRYKLTADVSRYVKLQTKVAEKRLKKIVDGLEAIEPTEQRAIAIKRQLGLMIKNINQAIANQKLTLEQVIEKLKEDAKNLASWDAYYSKVSDIVVANYRSKPGKAEKAVTNAKKLIEELNPSVKQRYARGLAMFEQRIAGEKKLAQLVGKDALELGDVVWVNGKPLDPAALKGKVVLLDFWAVWCGPCIATFPHLREWQEKYADKGLEIIGVTRYYNYAWDEDAGRATRSTEKVSPDEEHAMLEKFAKSHKLHHRFAVSTDPTLQKFYGVTGIPHVVIIDRSGKIRMIRVGSGPQNAKDIGGLLDKLITPASGD